ncbi:hypothetical protein [Bacillus sp. V59.32b]
MYFLVDGKLKIYTTLPNGKVLRSYPNRIMIILHSCNSLFKN